MPLLGEVEDEVVEAFRNGGGVPYARYRRFHELMAESSAAAYERTAGPDRAAGARPAASGSRPGIDVADVGCGSGHAINLLAAAFPASRFTGYDLSEEGIAAAQADAEAGA